MLTDLFWARFDPDHTDRETSCVAISHALHDAIDEIASLEQDRALRRFQNLITSTLRTTFFQLDDDGGARPYLAFKLDPSRSTIYPIQGRSSRSSSTPRVSRGCT